MNKYNKGSGVDRRTGSQIIVDDEGHKLSELRGTDAQSIYTNEARDLGNTRGTGVQIAGSRKLLQRPKLEFRGKYEKLSNFDVVKTDV